VCCSTCAQGQIHAQGSGATTWCAKTEKVQISKVDILLPLLFLVIFYCCLFSFSFLLLL
jgi:hypothetical protein